MLWLLRSLIHLIFPALARHRSQGQNTRPPRTPRPSEPGVTSCTTHPPAAPADGPATTATTSHRSAAATSAHTARDGDRVDVLLITDATPRDDLVEALGHLNRTAMDMRRRGFVGTASEAYARQHRRIDALLYELEAASVEA